MIQFTLSSVDTSKLAEVEARFFEVLRDTADKDLDMEYMHDCVIRHRRKLKSSAENGATFFTDTIIQNFLFGNEITLRHIAHLDEFDVLEKWTDLQWRQLLKKWFADAPHVTVLGKPSAAMSERLKDEEESRIATRLKKLGDSGLKELEDKLAAAKAENDKEIPRKMLEKFGVPDTSSIHFITTISARSRAARTSESEQQNPIQTIIDQDPSNLALYIHFEHVPSNFVHISLFMGTESIPVTLRPLLAVYLENFFSSPIMRDGKQVEFEKVVMELERDTVDYSMESGTKLANPEGLRISLEVETEKYETAIEWLRIFLWDSVFDETVSFYHHVYQYLSLELMCDRES